MPRMPFLPVFVMAGAENKLTCVAGRAFLGSKPRYPIPWTLSFAPILIGLTSFGAKVTFSGTSSSESYKI